MRGYRNKIKLPTGLPCLLLLISLSACAQTSSLLGRSGNLTLDPADPCRAQRQSFADGQNYFAETILNKTMQGAVSGGMTSLATGNTTGFWTNTFSGAVGGLKAGYWDALQQQETDRQQLARSINSDLRRETLQIDHTAAAFASLRACRFAQARRIKSEARTGHIGQAEAQRELRQERDWFSDEIVAAESAGVNMQKRDDQFAYAADNLRKQDPAAPRSITVAATETIPQKRNTFESSIKEAQAESTTAFSLDANATARERRYA